MGLVATRFSRGTSMVGLEFRFRFRAPVPAGDPLELEWLVAGVRPTSRGARVVRLYGRLRTSDGTTAVGASGSVLVTDGDGP